MYFETGFYFYTPPTFIIVNAPSLYRGVHVYETTQTGSCVKTNKQLKKKSPGSNMVISQLKEILILLQITKRVKLLKFLANFI